MTVELPGAFVRTVSRYVPDHGPDGQDGAGGRTAYRPDGQTWLARLPGLIDTSLGRWRLREDPDQPVRWGSTALVVPVLRPHGDPGMLKLGWPHPEADVEHLALRAWRGRGAVRLLAAEPADGALLLERLDATRDLTVGPVAGTCEALGTLLGRLDRPGAPWAPALSDHLRRLSGRIAVATADPAAAHQFPRRLLLHAASLVEDLLQDGGLDGRLVHTDLHQANVLWRADPGEWVAIDPKVESADPHWAVAPALWNRWEDALAAPDLGSHLLLRLDLVCGAAGLDRDRARAMSVLRLVDNALWALRDRHEGTGDDVTRAVAVIKAMQRG